MESAEEKINRAFPDGTSRNPDFPAGKIRSERFREQLRRAWAICCKDTRIYYFKAPVLIYGIILPFFIFLAFSIGRKFSLEFLLPGMTGMTLFFASTAVVPLIAPWETRTKTLERLVSAPVGISTIITGDVLASFFFGCFISLIPILIGLLGGLVIDLPYFLAGGILMASFCFSSLGAVLSSPPTDTPANVMMLSSLVKLSLIFISGVFIPLGKLPLWARALASASPLTYFIDLVRFSIQGNNYYSAGVDLLMLLIFAVLFSFLAVKLHQRGIPKRI